MHECGGLQMPDYFTGPVRVFRQKFTLEDTIGSHAFAPLEANMRVTNGIPLGSSLSYQLML
jgi:hypothetical protein